MATRLRGSLRVQRDKPEKIELGIEGPRVKFLGPARENPRPAPHLAVSAGCGEGLGLALWGRVRLSLDKKGLSGAEY